jgi:hypothetical protein
VHKSAQEIGVEGWTGEVSGIGLQKGIENSLLVKLDTAIDKLEDDNEKNDKAAITSLQAFIHAVEAQGEKKIPENVNYLIEAAQQIIDMLGSE